STGRPASSSRACAFREACAPGDCRKLLLSRAGGMEEVARRDVGALEPRPIDRAAVVDALRVLSADGAEDAVEADQARTDERAPRDVGRRLRQIGRAHV